MLEYAIPIYDGPVDENSEMCVLPLAQLVTLDGPIYVREVGPWRALDDPFEEG